MSPTLRIRLFAAVLCLVLVAPVLAQPSVQLSFLGRYAAPGDAFDVGAAEIVAHDPVTQRLFVINARDSSIDVLDAGDPTNPIFLFAIDVSPYGKQANSVAVSREVVAAAVENNDKQMPGRVVFFDTDGHYLNDLPAGALPDMLTFTPNGRLLLVANEGEPSDDYTVDPEGTVTIIRMRSDVENLGPADIRTVDFTAFNGTALDPNIRIFGPGATVAQDLEPEYIAVSRDSKTAWVVMQENNAVAVLDLKKSAVLALVGLGFKDHMLAGNGLDPSNRDAGINIANWPVRGMYQPDAIASFRVEGEDYLISANEGDARDYAGYSEEARIKDLLLDPVIFPDAATLQRDENLGRLNSTLANGDTDGDPEVEELYAYGARSFSIWDKDGALVYDSGDMLEQITAAAYPDDFNANNDENGSFDSRSDDKGPEPEGIALGKIKGRIYAFIGLERIGGIAVFNITDPAAPAFVQYINSRDFSGDAEAGTAGDLGPEGLLFIRAGDSPTGTPLLVVAYEVSGTTAVFEIDTVAPEAPVAPRLAGALGTAAQEAGLPEHFALLQNYPNPFNPETSIRFQLPAAADVSLKVFDTLGRQVRTLAAGAHDAGTYSVRWDGRDAAGRAVASGTYFYRLVTGGLVQTRAMVLLQ